MTTLHDIIYVSDGQMRRADIVIDGDRIARITDRETLPSAGCRPDGQPTEILLPGVIDDHVHTREPGLTHKGDLSTESHAAAAGGVTSIMDMPNVVPQTTTLQLLSERQQRGAEHAFVNYAFHFGATTQNVDLLPQLDPTRVPSVKLFMGSSTGNMLVDEDGPLDAIFRHSPLPVMAHCEDSAIISSNMQQAVERYGDDPDVRHHAEIRSREACLASSRKAVELALKHNRHLHIAHISTAEELNLTSQPLSGLAPTSPVEGRMQDSLPLITLEACLPHLLFCDEDYATLGTRIKCNPSVKTRADREVLRRALTDGRIHVIATDHAPHLLTEKQGGCRRAASGIPMVQFSLVAMMELVEERLLSLPQLVQLMCHNPARLFRLQDRGFIREGMKADLVLLRRQPWTLTPDRIVSRCGWSPLEGRTFSWQVHQTFCNGRLIYDRGTFAPDNHHAQPLLFAPDRS